MVKKASREQFGKEYARLITCRESRESVNDQVDFIARKLSLGSKASVLDIGCGNGRHAITLAKRGYDITAIDSSPTLLAIARRTARRERVRVKFLLQDALDLPCVGRFDAAISMFSFGFFKQRKNHQTILKRIACSLKKGGKFMLVTSNSDYQLKKIFGGIKRAKMNGPHTVSSKHILMNGINETRRIYLNSCSKNPTISTTSLWTENGQSYEMTVRMHIFSNHEIKLMLTVAGLKLIHLFSGNTQSKIVEQKPSHSSPVSIFIAEK